MLFQMLDYLTSPAMKLHSHTKSKVSPAQVSALVSISLFEICLLLHETQVPMGPV